ncbi:MAG TPA: hybrid sensor histidine kinase/response regulator, partial [Cyanobacteria bacterium UBA9273]|nr:hybrid sensor histidine kinase/response regulator [Cyanobacteria bacterium UBA9273]
MSSITAIDLAAVPYHPLTLLQIGNIWMEVFADKSDKFQKHNARTNPSLRLAQELPLRILLAEDQLIDRTVALRILQSLGYQADVAVNGQEALKALHHKHYDLLLTDVQMPQMGGLELMQRICQEWSLDERPCIIAVTS